MEIKEIILPLELPPPKTPRSPGIHVSGIIRAIALEVGILDKKWADDFSLTDAREITDQGSILRMRIGLAWEEHLIPTLNIIDHPGEMKLEGVYMTHDGESVDRVYLGTQGFELICHEIKATYKSTKKNLRDEWLWIAQLKAYCKALGTRFARIYILYICGDYSYPMTPIHKVYEVEFEQEELDVHWNMLVEYVQYRKDQDNCDITRSTT